MSATQAHIATVAPPGEASPPPPTPAACAPIPLRRFLANAGLEVIEMGGALHGVSPDSLEVYGFAPAGPDGKPDMNKVRLL